MKISQFISKKYLILFFSSFFLSHLEILSLNKVRDFSKKFNGISIFYKDPHEGLTSSILRGLKKLQIPFNVNPNNKNEIKDVFLCLQDANLLRYGINLKEKKHIKKLLVGPNMFARAYEENHLLSHQAIDSYLSPSEWAKISCIEDEPPVANIIRVWPAGVDSDYWKPENENKTSKKVLIYWKTEPEEFCDQVKNILINFGWEPIILKYGTYKHDQYKKRLNRVKFVIFLSRSESQGLALAECWSMNIPTLAWDPGEQSYMGKKFDPVTSCPYLTNATGKRWKKLSELEYLLKNIPSYWQEFSPREWVLNNMTDEVSVNLLLKIINE